MNKRQAKIEALEIILGQIEQAMGAGAASNYVESIEDAAKIEVEMDRIARSITQRIARLGQDLDGCTSATGQKE